MGDESYLELSTTDGSVTLWEAGEYLISNITETAHEREEAGFGSLLRDRIQSITTDRGNSRSSTSAGIRGAEAAEEPSVSWAGAATPPELIAEGVARLERQGPEAALVRFQEARQLARDETLRNEALFYIGYAHSLAGEERRAIEQLEAAQLPAGTRLHHEHTVTLARLYVDLFDYDSAISLMKEYLGERDQADAMEPQRRQEALLVLGMAQRGLDREREARESLNRARELAPDTRAGEVADRLLARREER